MDIKQNGFTLIELLIVIAIIAILASIVLMATSDARNEAFDKAVMHDLSQIRTVQEFYYDKNNRSFSGFCTDPQTTTILMNLLPNAAYGSTIDTAIGDAGGPTLLTCHDSPTSYAIAAPLRSSAVTKWACIDSVGTFQIGPATLASNVSTCPP